MADADGASAIVVDLDPVSALHEPRGPHIDQTMLTALVAANPDLAFETAFEVGDEMFETVFNALDGVGANVGGRAALHARPARGSARGHGVVRPPARARDRVRTPRTATPATTCPSTTAPATRAANVHRDPLRGGVPAQFIQRNTPHLFAPGAVQRLAEEMTADLQRIRSETIASVCATGSPRTARLEAKGVSFGSIQVSRERRHGAAAPT